jgi:hypothetical protein
METIQQVQKQKTATTAVVNFLSIAVVASFVLISFGKGDPRNLIMVAVGSFFVLSLLDMERAVVIFILAAPFHFVVRGYFLHDIILSVWRELLFAALLFAWHINIAVGRLRLTREVGTIIILIFNLYGICGIVNAPSILVGLAGFKETVRFSALYLVVFSLLRRNPKKVTTFVYAITAAGLLFSVIQGHAYFTGAEMGRLVESVGSRIVFGRAVERMLPFITGAPAEIGRLVAPIAVMCLSIGLVKHKGMLLWFMAFVYLVYIALLTVSQTALLILMVGLLGIYLGYRTKKVVTVNVKRLLAFLLFLSAIVILVTPGFWIGTGDLVRRGGGMIAYWLRLVPADAVHFIIGKGFRTGSRILHSQLGYDYSGDITTLVDWGWAGLAYQLGVPMAIGILAFVFSSSIKGIVMARKEDAMPFILTASVGALAFSLNFHGIPWTSMGADVYIFVLLAIVNYYRNYEYPSRHT